MTDVEEKRGNVDYSATHLSNAGKEDIEDAEPASGSKSWSALQWAALVSLCMIYVGRSSHKCLGHPLDPLADL